MVNNVRGYKTKEVMIKRIMMEENPVLMAIVETKLKDDDAVEIPGYEFSRVNRNEDGGGVLLFFRRCLAKIMIEVAETRLHDAEILWNRLDNGKVKIKIGVVYMPQESRTKLDKLKEIYKTIEEQVAESRNNGESILILGDLNCKIGKHIQGNTDEITKGGRLLLSMVKKFKLKIVNADPCCEGRWTRIEGQCKSILDYVIVFEEDIGLLETMKIDEDKDITPYYIERTEGMEERKYTDHSMIKAKLNLHVQGEKGQTYTTVMDDAGIIKFKKKLEEEQVSNMLEGDNIQQTFPIWSKRIHEIREKCSKRVKIKKNWKVSRKLTKVKKSLTRELKKTRSKDEIRRLRMKKEVIKQQIEREEQIKEYTRINKIVQDIKKDGGVHSNTFWKVRRKLCGKVSENAHAMMDKDGKMCEDGEEIKQIHAEWFQQLLTTNNGSSRIEKEAEEINNLVWKSMLSIAKSKPPIETTEEEVKDVVKNLNPRKAKDADSWKNSLIKAGGEEMIKSLTKIANQVDGQMMIPHDWMKMEIMAIHKAGARYLMGNKRGLFMTHNISKVYEKVVKKRNNEDFNASISEWATGGVTNRAPVDNVMLAAAVMEQNKYMKRNTYLVLTDAEKCFDKLWLMDGVSELWRCGTDVRDCVMIKKLNEKAEIVVRTPVGNTEPFTLSDIVRQGSVYGPQICIASMDKINMIGRDVGTYYGPDLLIRAVIFVDDVSGMGQINMANNLIYNCSLMEERKKMIFSNKRGKTECMVIGDYGEEIRTISKQLKRGVVNRVKEHKMLGSWFDETGDYGINSKKRKENLQYMISFIKRQASPRSIGIYTVEARLVLAEAVIIPSILYNVEAFPVITERELKDLESIQLSILTNILELPSSTPYYALLMEVGWWTMKGRVAYRRLMLYHNIIRSDKRRVLKRLLEVQEKEDRETTWRAMIGKEIERYNINLDVEEAMKSTWKNEVKKKINEVMESEIREKCNNSKKARFVKEDKFERKTYLNSKVNLETAKTILRARLNMCYIPANYKNNGDGMCTLCECEEGSTEHYFSCKHVRLLAKVWDVKRDDMYTQETTKMVDMARFMKKTETMLNPERKT